MPKVYLTTEDRQKAAERRCNDVLSKAVRLDRGLSCKPDHTLAEAIGVGRATLSRYKHPDVIGNISLNTARKIAKETGMAADEWLMVGGYK